MENTENTTRTYAGALGAAIARSPQQVRDERAAQIVEASRLNYRRRVEDQVMLVKQHEARLAAQLDLNPDNTQCLISAKNFNDEAFISTRLGSAIAIKEAKEILEVMVADYTELFDVAPQLDF